VNSSFEEKPHRLTRVGKRKVIESDGTLELRTSSIDAEAPSRKSFINFPRYRPLR